MERALEVCLILAALASVALSAAVPDLGNMQRDEKLRASCPAGWDMLYLDSDHLNPTCIYLDMVDDVSVVELAKARCQSMGAWLAEPVGWLHHEIYQAILTKGYDDDAFWIGGSDQATEGSWVWERTGEPMPMGTPHWEHCSPSQPLPNDRNSNYACIWPKDYYFFSCTNGIEIRTLCQMYPTAY